MERLLDEPNAGLEPAASRLEVSRATIALAGPRSRCFDTHGGPQLFMKCDFATFLEQILECSMFAT
jgi:hypothetical protein